MTNQNQQKERPQIQCRNCGHCDKTRVSAAGLQAHCDKLDYWQPANYSPVCLFSISKSDGLRKLGLMP
jgi:hypothetical protein